ncbi:hypothetical protein PPTG_19009 [Phytophthora nicotianae INRA-310]|uniref:Uncharacterized protein n=1 Tax=Phytophthora nicotianae (strain INRA-310) TaxID=761204 RepID=W2PE65_PHYN3|nr:hypothetical protein PPTG_19009 [Phytophthora nicotianae INRA-310]ETM99156.1 hypothetical protein PPTG_19009 [Phytophthora nicotianae INRA-310]
MVGTRGSAPHEDVAALPEAERGTKHFRVIWPEFKKLGWTSKPPPSRWIETRWKYILPGGNANGTVGIDYVLGEQAVVDHATEMVRQQAIDRGATAATEAAKKTPAERPSRSSPKSPVRTTGSQSTTSDTPADTTPSVPIARASEACTQQAHTPPTSQSPDESNVHQSSTTATTTEVALTKTTMKKKKRNPTSAGAKEPEIADSLVCDEESKASPDITELIDLSGNDADDANTYHDDERNYQVLDSGDESEEGDLNDLDKSDSEASVSDTIDEDDDDVFSTEERHFANHFLEKMGGEDKVLAGEILGPALKEVATTGWHEWESPDVEEFLQTPYTPVSDGDVYPDLLKAQHGSTEAALNRGGSPIALFFLFMPVSMWPHISECSNFYMHEQLDKRVDEYFQKKGSFGTPRQGSGESCDANQEDEDSP